MLPPVVGMPLLGRGGAVTKDGSDEYVRANVADADDVVVDPDEEEDADDADAFGGDAGMEEEAGLDDKAAVVVADDEEVPGPAPRFAMPMAAAASVSKMSSRAEDVDEVVPAAVLGASGRMTDTGVRTARTTESIRRQRAEWQNSSHAYRLRRSTRVLVAVEGGGGGGTADEALLVVVAAERAVSWAAAGLNRRTRRDRIMLCVLRSVEAQSYTTQLMHRGTMSSTQGRTAWKPSLFHAVELETPRRAAELVGCRRGTSMCRTTTEVGAGKLAEGRSGKTIFCVTVPRARYTLTSVERVGADPLSVSGMSVRTRAA